MESKNYTLLDVQAVQFDNPSAGVKSFTFPDPSAHQTHRKIECDILIAGGSMGGVAAAMKIIQMAPNTKICLTEETDWLGGQMTSQAVSALDENQFVETSGACRSYQEMRNFFRKHYSANYKLSAEAKSQVYLNPGDNWVTRLSFEPQVAVDYIDQQLNASISSGHLQIFKRYKMADINTATTKKSSNDARQNHIDNALAINLETGEVIEIAPKIVLDATELGDLLPLAKVAYSVGSDNRRNTTELHAPEVGDKENVQDYVYPFVLDFHPETDNTIAAPLHYDKFNNDNKFGFDGYKMFEDSVIYDEHGDQGEGGKRTVMPFWTYRRLIAKSYFEDPAFPFDIAMINWDSNDLRGHNIIDQPPEVAANRLALAKSLSLGFLYWLQTEAQRDDSGKGYKELLLRKDVLGTKDGLSMYPYIREARRIKAKRMIIEQDIVSANNPSARAQLCKDSVGIGQYFVDIHGMQEVKGTAQATKPFQIPLGSLIPEAGGNLLPACKNIGVTHITNGAYRLHPIEWAIGEAQGTVAVYCLENKITPEQILQNEKHLKSIQKNLIENGSPLFWFDDVSTTDQYFAAIQFASLFNLMEVESSTLHFYPEQAVSVADAKKALQKLVSKQPEAITRLENLSIFKTPDANFSSKDLSSVAKILDLKEFTSASTTRDDGSQTISRASFAKWLYDAAR